MKKQEMDQLISDYEGLFHRVLQRAGIFPGQVTYEDDLQELRLLFFLRAQNYPTRGLFEMENEVTYLFRFLLWRLIDLKRKKTVQTCGDSEDLFSYLGIEEPLYEEIEVLEQLRDFYNQLSGKDQVKCQALIGDEGLSRQNRSRYRKYFRTYFNSFFKNM